MYMCRYINRKREPKPKGKHKSRGSVENSQDQTRTPNPKPEKIAEMEFWSFKHMRPDEHLKYVNVQTQKKSRSRNSLVSTLTSELKISRVIG